jgi:hypothetical protein
VARSSSIAGNSARAWPPGPAALVQRRLTIEGNGADVSRDADIAPPVASGVDRFGDAVPESSGNGHLYVFRKQRAAITGSPGDVAAAIARAPAMSAPALAPAPAVSVDDRLAGSAPAPSTPSAESSSQPAAAPDIEELVEQVTRRLFRRLEIEHERRGSRTWR